MPGLRVRCRLWAAGAGVVVAGVIAAHAAEPVEAIRVALNWTDEAAEQAVDPPAEVWETERPLQVAIAPLVEVVDAELQWVIAADVVWRAVDDRGVAVDVLAVPFEGRPGFVVARFPLGRLTAGTVSTWRFRVRVPSGSKSIAEFAVEGQSTAGRAVRDAATVAIGSPDPAPRARFGAKEYAAKPGPGLP